jgi:hypothetical protein
VHFATNNVRSVWGQLKEVLCFARSSERLVCFCSPKGGDYAVWMKLKLSDCVFVNALQSAVLMEGLCRLECLLIIGVRCVTSDSD